MAVTYETIQSYTASGASGSIDFTSIPQTYKALALHISAKSSRPTFADDDVKLVMNNDTGISCRNIRAYGYSASSYAVDGGVGTNFNYIGLINAPSNQTSMFGVVEYYFPNYTDTTVSKVVIASGGSTVSTTDERQIGLGALVFTNTSAITRLTLSGYNDSSNTWKEYSTFYLYGIKYS